MLYFVDARKACALADFLDCVGNGILDLAENDYLLVGSKDSQLKKLDVGHLSGDIDTQKMNLCILAVGDSMSILWRKIAGGLVYVDGPHILHEQRVARHVNFDRMNTQLAADLVLVGNQGILSQMLGLLFADIDRLPVDLVGAGADRMNSQLLHLVGHRTSVLQVKPDGMNGHGFPLIASFEMKTKQLVPVLQGCDMIDHWRED